MQLSLPIRVALHWIYKIISLYFHFEYEEVPLQFLTEFIYFKCWEDLKSKFFTYHILDFYKNHVPPSG